MLTLTQANDIRSRSDAFQTWLGKRTSYRTEDIPADVPRVTNDELSALETFDFVNNPPVRYFAYVNEASRKMTTWTGDILGNVTFGAEYRDNFGGKRVPIRVSAINGNTYSGTYFTSSGSYCRVKVCK